MRSPLDLRRLLLLAMLLPQLIVLGLGREVFVCIAADGHVEVELASSACCTGPEAGGATKASGAERDARPAAQGEEPGCGSCSDYRIAVDPRFTRASTDDEGGVTREVSAIVAHTSPALPNVRHAMRHADRSPPCDRGVSSPHLVHVRSIVLRC